MVFWPTVIGLAVINAILSIWIAYILFKNRKIIKSRLTSYLLIFSILFLFSNIISVFVYTIFSFQYGPDIAIPLIPINLMQLIAIIFLFKVINH